MKVLFTQFLRTAIICVLLMSNSGGDATVLAPPVSSRNTTRGKCGVPQCLDKRRRNVEVAPIAPSTIATVHDKGVSLLIVEEEEEEPVPVAQSVTISSRYHRGGRRPPGVAGVAGGGLGDFGA